MRQTKKITISAMLVALGVAFMALGAVIEVMDLSLCALASLLVVFAYLEIGSPFVWLVWLCTSLATFLCFPASIIWIEYFLVFGVYPILKAYFEKAPRILWIPIKLAYINAIIWLLSLGVQLILGIPFFDGETLLVNVVLYIVINVAFFVYDMFITVSVRLYFGKIRHRFSKFLK